MHWYQCHITRRFCVFVSRFDRYMNTGNSKWFSWYYFLWDKLVTYRRFLWWVCTNFHSCWWTWCTWLKRVSSCWLNCFNFCWHECPFYFWNIGWYISALIAWHCCITFRRILAWRYWLIWWGITWCLQRHHTWFNRWMRSWKIRRNVCWGNDVVISFSNIS